MKTSKKAMWWFYEEFDVKSYRAFKEKYPRGSEGNGNFMTFVGVWEVLSILVNNGLLSEDLAFDMFALHRKKRNL